MKNMYGETVKPQYDVALKQHVKGDVADDYETVDFIGADNYKEACKIAKAQSKGIGKNNDRFHETERLNAGLAIVSIVCYYSDDVSDYNEVWQEDYVEGKKVGRYKF
nr:MAG TPA: hypothetical protein [Bacteriophage sp.]